MALIDGEYDRLLRTVATALGPYLQDIVFIGGAASAFYRFHPMASSAAIAPLRTKDIDLASDVRLPIGDRPPLHELLQRAELEATLHGDATPPIMKFVRKGSGESAEVEFLCPLAGRSRRSSSLSPRPTVIQDGITAQALRYVDILLFEPWRLPWQRIPDFSDLASLEPLRMPNPASYVVHKILVLEGERRSPPKREKDCYYIHEAAVLFREATHELSPLLERLRMKMPKRWYSRFIREAKHLFASPRAEGPTSVVRVSREAQRGRAGLPSIDSEMAFSAVSTFFRDLGLRGMLST